MRRHVISDVLAGFAGAAHLALAFFPALGHGTSPAVGDHGGHHPSWMAPAFAVVGLTLVAAALAARRGDLRARPIAAAVSGVTAIAYLSTRVSPIAGHAAEGWTRTGVATLVAEVIVVLIALAGVASSGARLRRRAAVGAGLALTIAVPTVAVGGGEGAARPEPCLRPGRTVYLEAVQVPGTTPTGGPRLAYRRTDDTAPPATPGPLLEMTEGECIAVHLTNSVPEGTLAALRQNAAHPLGVSLHVHGVKYTQSSDGTLGTSSIVPPGQSRTYIWYAAPRASVAGRVTSLGTAGYWWYHDHVVGTSHGTGGVEAGLWGGLVVRRAGDLRPDRTHVVGLGGPGPVINAGASFACDTTVPRNRPGPDCLVARKGERVEFLVIGVPGKVAAEDFHEFHLHGHNWADNRTGMVLGPADETRIIDAKVIGPSETFGFQVVAGEDVGAGDWMLHCHVQQHSDAGMSTFFRVTDPGAPSVPGTSVAGGTAHDHGTHS